MTPDRIAASNEFRTPSPGPQLALWQAPADATGADSVWHEAANQLYLQEAFRSVPNAQHQPQIEPYSLAWYEQIEERRYARTGRWLPKVLEFQRHSGETILCLGEGGTDWLQYARRGAKVIACSPSAEQLGLVRQNFELRGQEGRFVHAPPHRLPLDSSSIDVVCFEGLLHEMEDSSPVVDEIFRVLRPGGKVLGVIPARQNVQYWSHTVLPILSWFGRREEGFSYAQGQTRRALKQLFQRFHEHKISQRHIKRATLPHLLRWIPTTALERVMGEYLILKAFKPLSVAMPVPTVQAA